MLPSHTHNHGSPVRMFSKAFSTLVASKAEVSINERLLSPGPHQYSDSVIAVYRLTSKLLCLLGWDCPKVSQIALVSHQHDDNVGVRMVSQLFQPALNILVGLMLADIVHQKRADRTAIVCGCDGAIAFLACSVPDLSLDGLSVDLDGARRKFDADGRFAVKVELVAGES